MWGSVEAHASQTPVSGAGCFQGCGWGNCRVKTCGMQELGWVGSSVRVWQQGEGRRFGFTVPCALCVPHSARCELDPDARKGGGGMPCG